jgi:hypothetical protein
MENPISNYEGINTNVVLQRWSALSTESNLPEKSLMVINKKSYSEIFCTSKRTSKTLWELLAPILPDTTSKEARQSLDIAIYRWLLTNPLQNILPVDKVPFITDVEFNDEFTIAEIEKATFKVIRNTDGSLQLITYGFNPAKDIPAPLNTESFSFKIMAVSCDVTNGTKAGCYITELLMPYNDTLIEPQNIHLPLTAKQGDLIVIAMSIEYTALRDTNLTVVHNSNWMPSAIVWAGYN